MKIIHILLAAICSIILPQAVSAQHMSADSTWIFGGNIGANLNQTSFINWAAGGENTIGGNVLLNYTANYKDNHHIWDNRLELAYGINNTETTGSRKTNDKIYLSSLYGYEFAKNLYFSGLFNFQSQFTKGYTYDKDLNTTLVSAFMAPGYLTLGGGLTWIPKKWLTSTFTPVTWREVYVVNTQLSSEGAYGVTPGHNSFSEVGANLQMEINTDIMKNVNLYSRLILFSNYKENPENIDVNLEVQINMTINKWLSAYVSANMIYDDDINIIKDNGSIGPALQFKEALGIGLQIKL